MFAVSIGKNVISRALNVTLPSHSAMASRNMCAWGILMTGRSSVLCVPQPLKRRAICIGTPLSSTKFPLPRCNSALSPCLLAHFVLTLARVLAFFGFFFHFCSFFSLSLCVSIRLPGCVCVSLWVCFLVSFFAVHHIFLSSNHHVIAS